MFELDYDPDDCLSYSIWPAKDENGTFNRNYGLCLVDKNVPKNFEKEYDEYSKDDADYIKPVRIQFTSEDEEQSCSDKDLTTGISESVRVDTNDDGSISGFTKSWKDKNSYFTYSYHSTNEKDILRLMDKFKINKPE